MVSVASVWTAEVPGADEGLFPGIKKNIGKEMLMKEKDSPALRASLDRPGHRMPRLEVSSFSLWTKKVHHSRSRWSSVSSYSVILRRLLF